MLHDRMNPVFTNHSMRACAVRISYLLVRSTKSKKRNTKWRMAPTTRPAAACSAAFTCNESFRARL